MSSSLRYDESCKDEARLNPGEKTDCQNPLGSVEQYTGLELEGQQARGQLRSYPDGPDSGRIESGPICGTLSGQRGRFPIVKINE